MFHFFVRRTLVMIPTLLVISALVFIIIQLPEGDYLTSYRSPGREGRRRENRVSTRAVRTGQTTARAVRQLALGNASR
jgi:ABC-type dipeptide/oligopeptide/nickel transport system permease component